METTLNQIVEEISAQNALHGKKLKKNLVKYDEEYFTRAQAFLNRYQTLLENEGKSMDYSIQCYLQMIADVNYESVQFLKT